jgi:hypothetical protein
MLWAKSDFSNSFAAFNACLPRNKKALSEKCDLGGREAAQFPRLTR